MKSLLISVLLLLVLPFVKSGSFVFSQNQAAIDSLQHIILTIKDDSRRVYLNVAISKEYSKSDILNSLIYGEKALKIAEELSDNKLISYALFNLGVGYFRQGIMEHAVEYFFRYLEISREQNNNKAIAYAMVNIGAIYLRIKELDKAADYFEQALATFEIIYADSDKPGKETISIYNNLGVIAKERHEFEIAIDYYKLGISLARVTPGFNTELGNLLNNMGNLCLDLENYDESIGFLTEAMQLRVDNNDKSGIVKSNISLARYYQSQNHDEKALDHIYLALGLAGEVGVLSSVAEAQKNLFKYYNKRMVADSALKYHILYTETSEQLGNESAIKDLKNNEIIAHFRENERLSQMESKKRNLLFMLTGSTFALTTVILSLLFFLAWSRNKRMRLEKKNLELNAKNIELGKIQLEIDLDVRNKELATNVMYQIQKNELINNVVEKLQKQSISENKYPAWVLEIISDLKKTRFDSVWNEFEVRFQQVHNDFYQRLNEINAGLSPNERRLCAFLRLNMTTKEISSITGQSYRSIEVARTRLRKKLNLTNSETGLVEFLSTL